MTDFSKMTDKENFDHDAQIFLNKLKEWGVVLKSKKLIVLDSGLGDHLVFLKVLPEIKEKYKDIVIACCYNEVFSNDKDIQLISIAEANMLGDQTEKNLYKKMWDWDWKDSIENAYRELYGVTGVKNAS